MATLAFSPTVTNTKPSRFPSMLRIHVKIRDYDAVLCEPLEVEITAKHTAAQVVAVVVQELQKHPLVIAPIKDHFLYYNSQLHSVDPATSNLLVKNAHQNNNKAHVYRSSTTTTTTASASADINTNTNDAASTTAEYWFAVNSFVLHASTRWHDHTAALPPLTQCPSQNQFWFFPAVYACVVAGPKFGDLWFYRRGVCDRALAFLTEHVLPHDGGAAWLIGPAGGSKTTTAMAFALPLTQLQRNPWVVTWLQPYERKLWQFTSHSRKRLFLRGIGGDVDDAMAIEDVAVALSEVARDDATNHLLVIDAVFPDDCCLLRFCETWLLDAPATRRLVITSPLLSHELLTKSSTRLPQLQSFFVSSWTLDEYLAAIAHEPLFDAVQHNLDASDVAVDGVALLLTPEDRVRAKFFYAGGDAWAMFRTDTNQVRLRERANDGREDAFFNLYAHDAHSERAVAAPLSSSSSDEKTGIVRVLIPHRAVELAPSTWFRQQLAVRLDPLDSGIARANGTMLMACVRAHPWHKLTLHRLDGKGIVSPQWEKEDYEAKRLGSAAWGDFRRFPRQWREPARPCCGGYDFAFVDTRGRGLVRFVQLARPAHANTIHWGFFRAFAKDLETAVARTRSTCTIHKVEVFVVLAPWQVESYRVTKTTGKPLTKEIQYVRVEPCWREWREAATCC